MKIFKMNIRDLFKRNGLSSLAPTDILLQAQLPFLRVNFGSYLKDVEIDSQSGEATFVCRLPSDDTLRSFRNSVFSRAWGDFCPKSMTLSVEDCESGPITVRVRVCRRK